jgi:hypothetical protein
MMILCTPLYLSLARCTTRGSVDPQDERSISISHLCPLEIGQAVRVARAKRDAVGYLPHAWQHLRAILRRELLRFASDAGAAITLL